MPAPTLDWLAHCISEVRRRLVGEPTSECETPRARLLDEAARALVDEPWLFHDPTTTWEERRPPELAARIGATNLRMWLLHHHLNALVDPPATVAVARRLIRDLHALEARLDASLEREIPRSVRLRLEALGLLHPTPTFIAPSQRVEVGDAARGGRLAAPTAEPVRAFESMRDEFPPTSAWLFAKARQHWKFYRAFAFEPLFRLRRSRIRKRLPPSLLDDPIVRETFSAIEQLGPILDNFVFDARGEQLFGSRAAVADLSFLYMQLADELVDVILHAAGAEATLEMIHVHRDPSEAERSAIPLASLDAEGLALAGLRASHPVRKYRTDLGGMIRRLSLLRVAIEDALTALPPRLQSASRKALVDFFDHCFATFLDELHLPTLCPDSDLDRLPLADTQWHTYRKNNLVMIRWMVLRLTLFEEDPREHERALRAWGYMLVNFQIFDDMKDVFVDLGKQPNFALQIAWQFHREEYHAIERLAPTRRRGVDRNEVLLLDLRAPKTMLSCMRLSRLIALFAFDWLTEYVWDYRWRRNWLLRKRSFNLPPGTDRTLPDPLLLGRQPLFATGDRIVDRIFEILFELNPLIRELGDDPRGMEELLAYVLDVLGYDHPWTVRLAALPNLRLAYRFTNLRMGVSAADKALLLRRIVAPRRRAATPALREFWRLSLSLDAVHALARALDLPQPRLVSETFELSPR